MSRRDKHRFYLQVAGVVGADTKAEWPVVTQIVQKLGKITDSGLRTASDPSACWFEVEIHAKDPAEVRSRLNELDERVSKVLVVDPGEGKTVSKQLDLPGTRTR